MKGKWFVVLILSVWMLVMATSGMPQVSAEESGPGKTAVQEAKTGEKSQSSSSLQKEEVVYASLSAEGDVENVYVVNAFDVAAAGTLTDYGEYQSVRNLTDMSEIEQQGDSLSFEAQPGRFYYQGNLGAAVLPWNISIEYRLDGTPVSPETLAGKDGHLAIRIRTAAEPSVDASFFENNLLQISLSLDTETCTEISAPDAAVANAGQMKQITFMVMPGKEGDLTVDAEVTAFAMDGISIAAVPLSLPIELPDFSEWTGDLQSLSDAIAAMASGTGTLQEGLSTLSDGAASLKHGSAGYREGMTSLKSESSAIVGASASIRDALELFRDTLSETGEAGDLSGLTALPEGLQQLADGLQSAADSLAQLKEYYGSAYMALKDAMAALPAEPLPQAELQQLLAANPDSTALQELVRVYGAAMTAKGTYDAVKAAFEAVDSALPQMQESLQAAVDTLRTISEGAADGIEGLDSTALSEGLETLCTQYGQFHAGLVAYTDGTVALSDAYGELDSGIVSLQEGADALTEGAQELYDGAQTLQEETAGLPDTVQEELTAFLADYDKSDYTPVSFVSARNGTVRSVQFVIQSAPIQSPERAAEEENPEEETFWTRFLDLFKK